MSHGDSIDEAAAGLPRHRLHRQHAGGRHRRHAAPAVRHPVPPRGEPHPRGHGPCWPTSSTPAAAAATGTRASFVEEAVAPHPRDGGRRSGCICALSGGVDSAVAALLVHEAIGDRLTCVFVDNGLLRKDEAAQVRKRFARASCSCKRGLRGRVQALPGASSRASPIPSASARSSAGSSSRSSRRPRARLGKAAFLAQGTLYPDVIESDVRARPVRGDQEPPQRGRAAQEAGLQAGRAAARAVQGRGARGRPAPGAGRGVRLPPALPRARAWPCAAWARSREDRLDLLREADDILVQGDQGGRPLPQRSGSPSPCCCPCARSA